MANNDWLKLLSAANSTRADKIPAGFKTLDELSAQFGKAKCTIERKIPVLLESGQLVRGYYKRTDRAGRLVTLPHYRLITKQSIKRNG